VSEHVESTIVPYIQQIVDGGMAYVMPEDDAMTNPPTSQPVQGSVYFDVRAFEFITNGRTKYGKLAPDAASSDFFSWDNDDNNNNDDNDEGEPIRTKRDPRDFCLWKYRTRSPPPPTRTSSSSSPNPTAVEPLSVSYSSPWGPGRPGWHVECSAMIQQLSQDFAATHEFGVHAGGVDLKFPHHSNEIAQAEAFLASDAPTTAKTETAALEGEDGWNSREMEFKEWIPHWVHTGHLYVKGRKMSKSLKNFVTIREMLGTMPNSISPEEEVPDDANPAVVDGINNAWSSPADDFRLWVLGLSGAYRGPATYSKDRMEEARVIREKWVRFLMEGQETLERLSNADDATNNSMSSRLWGEEELELFHTVTQCSMNCQTALLDDLDGASFVKELIRLADEGLNYVDKVKMEGKKNRIELSKNRPEEPLRFVLDTFRGQLDLVGFSQRTVGAGLSASMDQHLGDTATSMNTALVDEAVAFRTAVRSAALSVMRKKKDGIDAAKEILQLCDEMRDDTFPRIGIEILDGKVVAAGSTEEGEEVGANRGWRHCSPREPSS